MDTTLERDYIAEPESAPKLRKAVSEFARRCGYYPELVDEITVAVGEAGGNIIEHSRSHTFILHCECRGDNLVICLEDYGQGFKDAVRAPDTNFPASRGYGMKIMRELMDRVDFTHKDGDGTIVRLEKRKKAS